MRIIKIVGMIFFIGMSLINLGRVQSCENDLWNIPDMNVGRSFRGNQSRTVLPIAHKYNQFVGLVEPTLIQHFSSERLTYHHPNDNLMRQNIIDLVILPDVSKTLLTVNLDSQMLASFMESYFRGNKKLEETVINQSTRNYVLPDQMVWSVYSKENNQFVGVIFSDTVSPWDAYQKAPRGELHDFYVEDIRKNTYINIAYAVNPTCQNRGYATEMTLALIEILFPYTTAEVIQHTSVDTNIASAYSATKCGFLMKGVVGDENFRILRKSSQERLIDKSDPIEAFTLNQNRAQFEARKVKFTEIRMRSGTFPDMDGGESYSGS